VLLIYAECLASAVYNVVNVSVSKAKPCRHHTRRIFRKQGGVSAVRIRQHAWMTWKYPVRHVCWSRTHRENKPLDHSDIYWTLTPSTSKSRGNRPRLPALAALFPVL